MSGAGPTSAVDAVAVAEAFVGSHAADYGLVKSDIGQLAVSSVVPSEGNG